MGLNEQVVLILSAQDKSQAAIQTFIRGLGGLSGGYGGMSKQAAAAAQATKILVVDQQKLADRVNTLNMALKKEQNQISASILAQQKYNDTLAKTALMLAAAPSESARMVAANKAIADSTKLVTAAQLEQANAYKAYKAAAAATNLADSRVTTARNAVTLTGDTLDLARSKQANVIATVGAGSAVGGGLTLAETNKLNAAELSVEKAYESSRKALVALNVALAEHRAAETVEIQENLRIVTSANGVTAALQAETVAQQELSAATAAGTIDAERMAEITGIQERAAHALESQNLKLAVSTELVTKAEQARNKAAAGDLVADPNFVPKGTNLLKAAGPLAAITAGAGVLLAGARASQDALEFNAAINQIASQTGNTGAAIANIQSAANAALAYANTGQSQYKPVALLQGSLLPITKGLSPQVVKQILPDLAQQSAVIKAPDLTLSGQGLISISGYEHLGANATAPQLRSIIDMVTAAEQRIPAPPATLTAALPKLFASFQGTGISTPAILGAETQLVRTTGATPAVVAGWLGQLARSTILKPTPAAQKLAKSLGIDLGAKGLAEAGGNPLVYWANLYAGIGGDENSAKTLFGVQKNQKVFGLSTAEYAAQLASGGGGGSGINALRAFLSINSPGAGAGAANLTDIFTGAAGTTGTAAQTLLAGQQQELTGITNRLNADFVRMGTVINNEVIPPLIALATAALASAEGVAKGLEGFGSWLDKHVPGGAKGAFAAANGPIGLVAAGSIKLTQDLTQWLTNPDGDNFGGDSRTSVGPALQRQFDKTYPITGNRPGPYTVDPITGLTADPNSAMYKAHLAQFNEANGLGPSIPKAPFVPKSLTLAGYNGQLAPDTSAEHGVDTGNVGGTAYKQTVYVSQAATAAHIKIMGEYARASQVSEDYATSLKKLNAALRDGNTIKYIDGLRDHILALSKDPALTLAMGPGASGKIAMALSQVNKGTLDFTAKNSNDFINYKNAIADFDQAVQEGANSKTLKYFATQIRLLSKDPLVMRALGGEAKATIAIHKEADYDAAAILNASKKELTATYKKASDAADRQLQAAQIFYNGVQIHHGSLADLNAAAQGVYQKQIRSAKAANKLAPDKQAYDNAVNQADATLQQSLVANLSPFVAEAQAKLSLDQAKGLPTSADIQTLTGLLTQQMVGQPNALALALYNLKPTAADMKPPAPGPKLLRPNLAGVGFPDASFMGSTSELAAPRMRTDAKQIALLEATIQRQDKLIDYLRQQLGVERSSESSLKSIDRKMSAGGGGKPRSQDAAMSNLRVSA